MKLMIKSALAAVPVIFLAPPAASDTANWVKENCASCHALDQNEYESQSIDARPERNGPPLFYAGNKFREEWLAAWLKTPERIRPAGDYPPAHIDTVDGEDLIDATSLLDHPSLEADRAKEVAGYLMSLRARDDLIAAVNYEPGNIAWRLGQMNFAKFNNCIACHQDEPDYGGLSGPELYTAWERLQPAFIASYITDPVAWDPHTLMPGGDLNEDAVSKLANYLKAVGEEDYQ